MTTSSSRNVWIGMRDAAMGLGLFAMLFIGLCGDISKGTLNTAAASGIAQAVALTSPTGPATENAVISVLLNRPAFASEFNNPSTMAILAATFAAMFAFNLAVLRHLRRAYPASARSRWARSR